MAEAPKATRLPPTWRSGAIPTSPSPKAGAQPQIGGNSRKRGPHADRTAAMRKRLIDAAITSLCRLGYAGTTLHTVTDIAQVSRGAMLHHFPVKVDLMLAAATYAAQHQDRVVRRTLSQISADIPRFLAITRATWSAMQEEPAIALVELMVGARSDPELGATIQETLTELERTQIADVWREAEALGITDRAGVETMVRLHAAALRGLLIDRLRNADDGGEADRAVSLLMTYKRAFTGDMLTQDPQAASTLS